MLRELERKDLDLPRRRREPSRRAPGFVELGELPVTVRRARDRYPVRHRRQRLETHPAGRQQVAIARLQVSAPEFCAEAKSRREVEDDGDIGPALVERRRHGLAELDVGHGLDRIAVADLESRALHPARGGQPPPPPPPRRPPAPPPPPH